MLEVIDWRLEARGFWDGEKIRVECGWGHLGSRKDSADLKSLMLRQRLAAVHVKHGFRAPNSVNISKLPKIRHSPRTCFSQRLTPRTTSIIT